MITTKHGSIFDSQAQVLVCPVNCVGVMGKGLALEFKRRWKEASKAYLFACSRNIMTPGTTLFSNGVLFAATKQHWRNLSELEWIDSCLLQTHEKVDMYNFPSIAIPQLGCGCGGLDWADVWPLYEKHLGGLDCDVEVWIHE